MDDSREVLLMNIVMKMYPKAAMGHDDEDGFNFYFIHDSGKDFVLGVGKTKREAWEDAIRRLNLQIPSHS